jgi:hypothetical protein
VLLPEGIFPSIGRGIAMRWFHKSTEHGTVRIDSAVGMSPYCQRHGTLRTARMNAVFIKHCPYSLARCSLMWACRNLSVED